MRSLFLLVLPSVAWIALLPVAIEAGKQLLVTAVTRCRLVQHHDVEILECCLVVSKRLPHEALDPVSLRRFATVLFCYRQPEPARAAFVLPAEDGKPFVPAARGFFEDPPVSGGAEQPFVFTKSVRRAASQAWMFDRRENRLRRQSGAALGAAARKHEAAGFCRHAGTETMGACAFQCARLKSAFHLSGTC